MDNVLNVAKQFINDPEGDYKYLGELEDGKHFVEYMFTDDCVDGDVVLCVGGPQCLVVTGGQCRYADSDESSLAMKHLAAIADEYMTLEDYKQQVYDYLTTKLGRTTQQARNLMKGYENLFQGYLDDGWTVPMMATAVLYNY